MNGDELQREGMVVSLRQNISGRTRWFLTAIILGLLGIVNLAGASDHCRSSPVPFASCERVARNYSALIVAVHGWNGSCRGTFGQGDESIFKVLGSGHHFYDFDCFQYDSRQTPVHDNARRLYERMKRLHGLGYRHVMLITHSTGGVIALQMLTDAVLDVDDEIRQDFSDEIFFRSDGMRVVGVQAWATPINGLRPAIQLAGRFVGLVGYSPETFPDLAADSEFLDKLKRRLAILGNLSLLPSPMRRRIQKITVNFYHGQRTDGVVHEIHSAQARSAGWLWPASRGEVIDTDTGHSHNVAESGQVGEPRFAGKTMQLEALLSLPFKLRYKEVFPSDLSSVPRTLEERQIRVIDGLTFYVRSNFAAAVSPAIDFLHKFITERSQGVRSQRVDVYVVDELLELLEDTPADDDLVRFLAGFGRRVLMHYDPRGEADVRRFGHNETDIGKRMLNLVMVTLQTVREYLQEEEEKRRAEILREHGYKTLKEFVRDMHTVLGLFVDHSSNVVQNEAIGKIRDVVASSAVDVVTSSHLLNSLLAVTKRKHGTLPQKQKTEILETLELAVRNSPSSRAKILEEWSREVSHKGRTRPLWATLTDDAVIANIVEEVPVEGRLQPSEFQFLADVASGGGATGHGLNVATMAAERLRVVVAGGEVDEEVESRYQEMLISSGKNAVYPTIRRQLLETAKNLVGREHRALLREPSSSPIRPGDVGRHGSGIGGGGGIEAGNAPASDGARPRGGVPRTGSGPLR